MTTIRLVNRYAGYIAASGGLVVVKANFKDTFNQKSRNIKDFLGWVKARSYYKAEKTFIAIHEINKIKEGGRNV